MQNWRTYATQTASNPYSEASKSRDRRSTERAKVMRAEGTLGKRRLSPVSPRLVRSLHLRRVCFCDKLARSMTERGQLAARASSLYATLTASDCKIHFVPVHRPSTLGAIGFFALSYIAAREPLVLVLKVLSNCPSLIIWCPSSAFAVGDSNWTEWSTIQGVIGRVISNRPSARERFEITSTITPELWTLLYSKRLGYFLSF